MENAVPKPARRYRAETVWGSNPSFWTVTYEANNQLQPLLSLCISLMTAYILELHICHKVSFVQQWVQTNQLVSQSVSQSVRQSVSRKSISQLVRSSVSRLVSLGEPTIHSLICELEIHSERVVQLPFSLKSHSSPGSSKVILGNHWWPFGGAPLKTESRCEYANSHKLSTWNIYLRK